MRATSRDLCTWHQALLSGKILSPASMELLLTPARIAGGQLPLADYPDAEGNLEKREMAYNLGLNFRVMDGPHSDRKVVQHGGGIFGFTTYVISLPENDITVATVCNSDGGGQPAFVAAYSKVWEQALTASLL